MRLVENGPFTLHFLKAFNLKKANSDSENLTSQRYSVIMQHCTSERILKIVPLVFEFILHKQKYKSFLCIISV